MKPRVWILGVVVCLALPGGWPALAANFYVDDPDPSNAGDIYTPAAAGNDANNGLTPATPKATLAGLFASTNLQAGDIVYIDTGTYAPAVVVSAVVGAAGNPITFQGSTNGTTFTGSGNLLTVNARHARFRDIRCVRGDTGIYLFGAQFCDFERIQAVSNTTRSIHLASGSNSNSFRRCLMTALQGEAVGGWSGRGNYLEACVLSSPGNGSLFGNTGVISNVTKCIVVGTSVFYQERFVADSGSRNLFFTDKGFHEFSETLADFQGRYTNWTENAFADPRFVNAAGLDFHLASAAGFVSNGVWVTNAAAGYSPAIDFGRRGDQAFTNEPSPNGGRVNIGLYGGTAEASKSNTNAWLFAMSYNDGGTLTQTGRLEWVASSNFNGQQVQLQYSTNNGGAWSSIATVAATNESHVWVPAFAHPAVLWRVASTSAPIVAATNARPFSIRTATNTVFAFYVNDDATAGDIYCTAAGNDGNSGVASNVPKRSLQAILNAYQLRGGDTVYVDTGDYATNFTTTVSVFDSGAPGNPVRILGSPRGSTFSRGNTSFDTMDLTIATNLVLENLHLSGGRYGLNCGFSNVVLRNLHFTGNQNGVYLVGSAHLFENCLSANNVQAAFIGSGTGSNRWLNGVMWGGATTLVATAASLSVSNSILGSSTTLFGNQVVPGDNNLVWNTGIGGGYANFTLLQNAGFWTGSLYANPQYADEAGGDYHLKSLVGRYNPATSNFVVDAVHSPAIDLGDPAAPVGAELAPNGGRLNAGLHGGTAQASKSRTNAWLQVVSYNDGGTLNAQAGVSLRWLGGNFAATNQVTLWLSRDDGASWEVLVAGLAATNGAYYYRDLEPDNTSSLFARWRVTLDGATNVTSMTPTNFIYQNGKFSFYVNDGSTAGDVYCTAVGNDANAGTGMGAPMASLATLLARYDLEPGALVYVDTGTYTFPTAPPVFTTLDSGLPEDPVVIQGSTNRLAGGTVFGSGLINLGLGFNAGASNIVLRDLMVANAGRGVAITNSANIRLEGVEVRGARVQAFDLQVGARNIELQGCVAHGGNIGVFLQQATNVALRNCVFWQNTNHAVYVGSQVGALLENSILASSGVNAALYSILAPAPGFAANFNGIQVGPNTRVGVNRSGGATADNLAAWQALSGGLDARSIPGDPQMADPDQFDYHLKTQETRGRVLPDGGRTADAVSSPLLDAGNPASTAWTNEPGAKGGRINIGRFGGTGEASIAVPSPWLRAVSFGDAGAVANGVVPLRWIAGGGWSNQTATVEVSVDGGNTWGTIVTSGVPVTNEVANWTVTGLPDTPAAAWRVTCLQNPEWTARSTNFFAIRNASLNLYVSTADTNDNVYCPAPGKATNWQATAAAPLDSLRTVFERFDLEPGDRIWVDSGTYAEPEAVAIGMKNSGSAANPVRIVGNTNAPFQGTVLARVSRTVGATVIDINRAGGVQLEALTISNAWFGISAQNGPVVGLTWVRAMNCLSNAILAGAGSQLELSRGIIHHNPGFGLQATGTTVKIQNTLMGDNGFANLLLSAGSTEVKNSILEARGTGRFVYFLNNGSLVSDYNNIQVVEGANVAGGVNRAADRFLIDWQISTGFANDKNSFGYDPLFANPAAMDYHLKSQFGRYNPATGTYTTADTNTSRLIDLGDPAAAFGNEPAPNGGRINVGLYGNTREASLSPSQGSLVPLTMSDGGTIRGEAKLYWSYNGLAGSNYVNILFSGDGGSTWTNLGTPYINVDGFVWNTTNVASTAQGVWRVELATDSNVFGQTETLFAVKNDPLAYYINDASTDGDVYCTGPGSAARTGLSPGEPMDSITRLFGRYKVDPGDIVYVDTGVYPLAAPLEIAVAAVGATNRLVIQGSTNEAAGGSVFTNASGTVIAFQGSQNVELRDLNLHGGDRGLVLTQSRSNRFVRIRSVGARNSGFQVDFSDQNQFIQCAALNFFRTGFAMAASTNNLWVSGVIAPVGVTTSGTATSTGFLVRAESGRLFVSNSVFAGSSPAHPIYSVGPDVVRGDYNCYHRPFESVWMGVAAGGANPFGVNTIILEYLDQWRAWSQSDSNSMEADPLFADLAAGDLHPKSAQGRYVTATDSWVVDAETSPLIDAADPALAWGLEPPPNGRRANLGVYGGTPFASLTPTNGTFVLQTLGQGGMVSGSQTLRWLARGTPTNANHVVNIQISTNSGAGFQTVGVFTNQSGSSAGSFVWDSTAFPSLPTVRWRVQSQSQISWTAASERDFTIRNVPAAFYVNDANPTNDVYTSAPGVATNTGRSAASPLPSLADVLARWDLEPGDTVWIDTGVYSNAAPAVVGFLDSGTAADPVRFLGSTNRAGSVFFGAGIQFDNVRGGVLENVRFVSQSARADVVEINRAEDIVLAQLDLAGSRGNGITVKASSNVWARHFSVAGATTNGIASYASFNTRLEFGVLWSNGAAQVVADNSPPAGGNANTNSFVTVSNCVLGAFGLRKPAYAVRGNLSANYNNLQLSGGALAALSFLTSFPREFDSVGRWSDATGQDLQSLSHDPKFADVGAGDFHLRSSMGRFDPASGLFTTDPVADNSPLIDAGAPAHAFANEPPPNGGRVNIGRHGNTVEASKTPTNAALTLISFNDGGRATGTNVPVNWLARGAATNGTVAIYYSANGGTSWTLLTNGVSAALGTWAWNSTFSAQSVQAKLKVELQGAPSIAAISDKLFSVRNAPFLFYLNDNSTSNDVYCSAVGNNTNSGLSASAPMADFNTLLAKYDLESGDTVYIDTGLYQGLDPWRVSQVDSAGDLNLPPVVFQGSTRPNGTVVDRSFNAIGIEVNFAIGVRLRDIVVSNTTDRAVVFNSSYDVAAENLTVGAGNLAFSIEGGAGIRVSRCVAVNCVQAAFCSWASTGAPAGLGAPVLEHNVFWQPSGTVISLAGEATLRNNIFAVAPGQYLYALSSLSGVVSDYNGIWLGTGGRVCLQSQPPAISPVNLIYETVGRWAAATGLDAHSYDGDPLLANPAARDFHLKSQAGRFVPATGGWTNDAVSSPLIDAGWPGSTAWTNEPGPNGGRVNIGLHGGTAQASKSATNSALYLLTLNRGGVASGPVQLNWKAAGVATGHTVRLDVSIDGGSNWTRIASGLPAGLGEVVWNSLSTPSSPLARWRVQDEQQAGVQAVSELDFVLHNGPIHYYVNDDLLEGDVYCSAAGSSGNTGLSPAAPKRRVAEIVAAYDLEPGDVIFVDTGNHQLAEPTVFGELDAGAISKEAAQQVTIQGSTNALAGGTLFLVPDPALPAFQLDGSYGLRFKQLGIVGARDGLAIQNAHFIVGEWLNLRGCWNGATVQASSNIFFTRSTLVGNQNAGVEFSGGRRQESLWMDSCVLWSNKYGIYLVGGNVYVTNSIFGAVAPGFFGLYRLSGGLPTVFDSDYNNLFVSGAGAAVGGVQSGGAANARTSVYATVAAWMGASGQDIHSLAQDPQLADPGNGDFHLKSRSGRFLPGTGWVYDAVNSPLLDAGDPRSTAWTAEPAPNGRRLNIGLYGGTAEASKSPTGGALTLISLNDGGTAAGTVELQWKVDGAATNYTLCLEYSPDDGATWTNIVCGWPASLSTYLWNSVPYGRSALGRWRALCLEDDEIFAVSQARFVLRNGGVIPYYVNDASTAGDVYCTAPGDAAHDGLTPATPKASLQAILDEYQLEPVDIVYVDSGTYVFGAPPLSITQTDSGWSNQFVTIQGSTNPVAPTVFRAPSLTTPSVISLDYAVNVRLKNLSVINAQAGVVANQTIGCELDAVRIEGHRTAGLQLQNNEGFRLVRSILRNNVAMGEGVAILISQSDVALENCVVWGSPTAVSLGSGARISALNSALEASGPGGRVYLYSAGANAASFPGDYNAYSLKNGALIAEQQKQAVGSDFYGDLASWSALAAADRHSMTLAPWFADEARGDFHPLSTQGRFLAGAWTNDAVLSPLVDAGSPASPVDREPSPNGGIVNIGAYGNTPEASMTQTNPPWLRVVSYNDAGTMSGTVLLYWLHGGMASNAPVRLEYSTDYEYTWQPIASNRPAGSREYLWDVSTLPLSLALNWRVVLQSNTNVYDSSDKPVSLKTRNYDYYVNDSSTAGDVWCSRAGVPWDPWTTVGTNPAMPIESLNALLTYYPVSGGDRVFVDTGVYPVSQTAPIVLRAYNSGTDSQPLLIYGSTNFLAGGARLVGNGTANGITLQTTRNIQIQDFRISGCVNGLDIRDVAGIKLSGLEVRDNLTNGVVTASGDVELRNCRLWRNGQFGLLSGGLGGRTLLNCTLWGNGAGQARNDRGLDVYNSILVATNLAPIYFENGASGTVNGDYNLYRPMPGGVLATNSFEKTIYANLRQWQNKGRDLRSFVADPLFVNPAAGDFHLQSRAGYWSNGTWAVSTQTSWAIDAGDPAATNHAAEPSPNGGRVNLGAYGGTREASKTDASVAELLPTTLWDGGVSVNGQPLYWLYRGINPTNAVRIEYSPDGGLSWVLVEGGIPAGSVPYNWFSLAEPTPEALWRVVLQSNTNVMGQTSTLFTFRPKPLTYYVNDASTAGDVYTTAIGAAGNRGYVSNSPLHSIQAVLNKYELDGGDEIRVDTGAYVLSEPVFVGVLHSGAPNLPAKITGSTNSTAGGTWFSPAAGLAIPAFNLYGVLDFNVSNFRLTGFTNGVSIENSASRCALADLDIQGSGGPGMVLAKAQDIRLDRVLIREGQTNGLDVGSSNLEMWNCVLWSNRGSAISLGGAFLAMTNSVLEASGVGNYCYGATTGVTIQADYNNVFIRNGAQIALKDGLQYEKLPQWAQGTRQDLRSLSTDPLFFDPAAGDFHPRSRTGRYQPGVGWVADVPVAGVPDYSPLIDLGHPRTAWSNEPGPNGGLPNIGLYGNTWQASKSATNQWVLAVTAMSGGLMAGGINLAWGYGGGIASNTQAQLQYSFDNGTANWSVIGNVAVGAREFYWQSDLLQAGVERFFSSPAGRWRIFLTGATNVQDVTDTYFGLRNSPFKYYLNDGSQANDVFATAIGDDANMGFYPAAPKRTLNGLLGDVDLEPTDQVLIDTGIYPLDTNSPVRWEASDAGGSGQRVLVRGSTNAAGARFVFDDPNTQARGTFRLDAGFMDVRDLQFTRLNLEFVGNSLVVSNLALTNGSLQLTSDASTFENIRVDRGAVSLAGIGSRLDRLWQRWGGSEIVGTNVTLLRSVVFTTNNAAIGVLANAVSPVVSNCTIVSTRGTAVAKRGIGTLRLGHNILVAGGTEANAVIAWEDGGLLSDWNNLLARDSAWIGTRRDKWERLSYWQRKENQDANSVSFDPMFQNEGQGDFHLKSKTGRWSPIFNNWDTDNVHSPLIDLGNPWIGTGDEPWPNGYRRNLGAYGGSAEASKSLTNFWLTALSQNDGGVLKGSNVILRWAAGNAASKTVTLQYSADGATWTNIATGLSADGGSYAWNTTTVPDGFYARWRVVSEDGSGVSDETDATFPLRNNVQDFYVNDASTAGDIYCAGPGLAANDGLTPATPKANLQQILDLYDLEGGDTVYVDTGTYSTNANLRIIWSRSGEPTADVVIQGNTNALASILDRTGATGFPAIGIDVKASQIQLNHLVVRNVDRGFLLDSNRNTTIHGALFQDTATGIAVEGSQNTRVRYSGFLRTGYGISLVNTATSVMENLTFALPSLAGIRLNATVLDTLRNNIFIPRSNAFAYAIGTATSLLTSATLDYNLYDLSAEGSGFFAGATRILRKWQLAMKRDFRSAITNANLANLDAGDFHPLSRYGRWNGNGWSLDTNTSWAVDHGDINQDYGQETLPNGGRRNIGMYGNTVQASRGDSTNVYYELRTLLDPDQKITSKQSATDPDWQYWPMIWTAHRIPAGERVLVQFSGGQTNEFGELIWYTLTNTLATTEYYEWRATIDFQTVKGRWRVIGVNNPLVLAESPAGSDGGFEVRIFDFGILTSPLPYRGLMRFEWQGAVQGYRYRIEYSDDSGKTWSTWEEKYNGPAPINMSNFIITKDLAAAKYVFEDRTSYLRRTRWYRILEIQD